MVFFISVKTITSLCDDVYQDFDGTGYLYYKPGHGHYISCTCSLSGAQSLHQYYTSTGFSYSETYLQVDAKTFKIKNPVERKGACFDKYKLNLTTNIKLVLNGSFYPRRIWLLLKGMC